MHLPRPTTTCRRRFPRGAVPVLPAPKLLALVVLAMAFLLAPLTAAQDDAPFDLLIRGGRLVDGTGNPWVRGDVAVRGDRIARIGHLPDAAAERVIDAAGLVVAPGFVDPHTHAVRGIYDVPTADNYLLQGVTTLTEGNDGASPWPVGEHLARIAATRISPNWAVFAGQGTIRRRVLGNEEREPTRDELERMRTLVARAMEEGALACRPVSSTSPGASRTPPRSSPWRRSPAATAASTSRTCATRRSGCSTPCARQSASARRRPSRCR